MRTYFAAILCASASLFAGSSTASANTDVDGMIHSLHHFEGHHGILVKLDGQMIDPEACGRTDWYILPDSSAHAQFVQAMLLTAQSSQRRLYVNLHGCLDGMPVLRAVHN
jgi:hypothetical protein